jgi:hypothetical protein
LFNLFLAPGSIQLPIPNISIGVHFFQLLVAVPFVAGFLLARESRGELTKEVASVVLLEIAVIIPATIDANTFSALLFNLAARWQIMLFVLGLAFVIDRNWKMIPGAVMILIALGETTRNIFLH